MHIHKIHKQTHHNFLEEERKDPITGDLIEIGSEVVFCARCKSAFLKDSWDYIRGEHCGQKHTLKYFPVSKELLLNAPLISPVFLTPLASPFSIKEWHEHLKSFGAEEKKVTIRLKSAFIENWKNILEPQPKIKKISKSPTPILSFSPLASSGEIKGRLLKKYKERNNILKVIDASLIAPVCAFPALFTLIILLASYQTGIDEISFWAIIVMWLYPILYLSYEFIKSKRSIEKQWKLISKKKRILPKKKVKPSIKIIKKQPVMSAVLFGLYENKFLLYDEYDNALYLNFSEHKITIFYQSGRQLALKIEKHDGENSMLSLVFFHKQQLSKFLVVFAKQKKHFSDESKVDLMDFPPNIEKFLRSKLDRYRNLVFFKSQTEEDKKATEEDINKTVIQVTDLRKLKKSQKVSRQSQNRNRHHQNRQQAQYRNYRRR